MQFIPVLSTSYEGLGLMVQFPFTLILAMIALRLAFNKARRTCSVGFAIAASIIVLAAFFQELRHNGFAAADGTLIIVVFVPVLIAIGVIAFGARDRDRPPAP